MNIHFIDIVSDTMLPTRLDKNNEVWTAQFLGRMPTLTGLANRFKSIIEHLLNKGTKLSDPVFLTLLQSLSFKYQPFLKTHRKSRPHEPSSSRRTTNN